MSSVVNVNEARISVTSSTTSSTRDIHLPNQLEDVNIVALDLGGSLSKVVYFSRKPMGENGDDNVGGRLHFERFATKPIDECVDFVEKIVNECRSGGHEVVIKATGGGAHKFANEINKRLNVQLQPFDEMRCLIVGLNFLLHEIPYEVFTVNPETLAMNFQEMPRNDGMFPYLLVNIGSGVSIIKVTGPNSFQRVSGTSVGGGTLWGLLSLLTDCKDYDQMLALATQGDNRNVDMLVGDIYGMDYGSIGLKSSAIASCFGKCFQRDESSETKPEFRPEDICKSALLMISNNIAQIAYLNAELHSISRIYFGGSFIRGHVDTMRTISYGFNFWSKGKMQAMFLRHDGYIGALGAFMMEDPNLPRSDPSSLAPSSSDLDLDMKRHSHGGSFVENFSRSNSISDSSPGSVGIIGTFRNNLTAFPLLKDSKTYEPDTLDLFNYDRRIFWLRSCEESIETTIQIVKSSMGDTPEVANKLNQYVQAYKSYIARLQTEPNAFGPLSVRSLLDVREQCLHEYVSPDPLKQLKQRENGIALSSFPERIEYLKGLSEAERQKEIILGLLAGNMFDWGAKEVVSEINAGCLVFESAKHKIIRGHKTWDLADAFLERLDKGPAYKKAVFFADNSGQDIVLGMVPFALYLVSRGTHVVIACNSKPALNDITYHEMLSLVAAMSETSTEFQDAVHSGRLSFAASGQHSPCLNLSRINGHLAHISRDADFVLLHGMGRAIHTNLRAKLVCDTLKLAVIKTEVVAKELDAHLYEAVVLFEPAPTV